MENKVLIIAGPTAVGKTSTSIEVAKKLDGEIISADSMQIYKGLNIGTAKPSESETCGIRHHMIDICHPSERFSVAQYVSLAREAIIDIISRGKTPIIVGGTGLYIDSLIDNNDFGEISIDIKIREELTEKAETLGGEALLEELRKIDYDYAKNLHANNLKRIIHSLEIYYSTGLTQTELIAKSRNNPSEYKYLYCFLNCSSRELLYNRIDLRVDKMLEEGLLREAESVISAPWYQGSTASQAIGYKELAPYFSGEGKIEECVEVLKRRSRNYAKRQLTWFRRREDAKEYCVDLTDDLADKIVTDYLTEVN